ncbi:hypothetical protein ACPRNU_22340 [Chromobacterium vaccinii]|uniref:hypothetical protein n=1 Tax=Chromobacterium vaccinii TaxID=1108595 RepID=UPI003C72604D
MSLIIEGAPDGEKVPLNPQERLKHEPARRAVTLNDAVTDLRGITVHETWSAGAPAYLNRDTH